MFLNIESNPIQSNPNLLDYNDRARLNLVSNDPNGKLPFYTTLLILRYLKEGNDMTVVG